MNLFKKLMTGVAVGALTLAVAGGIGSVSADAAATEAEVSAANQTITVQGANEVLVAYPTVKGDILTAKSWDVHTKLTADAESIVVDVSTLNATKDNYVLVKTDTTDATLIKFQAVGSKAKGVYNAQTQKVEMTDAGSKLQYRTAAGSWANYTANTDLVRYEMAGATVYFRETPQDSISVDEGKEEKCKLDGKEIKVTTLASFGGKEIKVKVTKRANGPKATVDLDKGVFVIAKSGTSYRTSAVGAWKTTDKDKVEVSVTKSNKGVFEVKTAAVGNSDAKKTKPESKITQYAWAAAPTVNLAKGADDDTANATVDVKTNSTKASADGEAANELTFAYTPKSATVATPVGITIKNESEKAYQVIITTEADKTSDAFKALKPTAVAAGKADKAKEVKIAMAKAPEGSLVYVRYASDKKAGTWASDYVLVGKIKY